MKYLAIAISLLLLVSCTTLDVYEKTKPFNNHQWSSTDKPSFSFDIKDTTSYQNFYFVLRHTEAYPYKNIWLELTIKSPYDTTVLRKEFKLADNNKWLGNSIDDIVEHRVIFNPQAIQLRRGTYSFTLKQIMRDDPLPHILSAGIRVQKTTH